MKALNVRYDRNVIVGFEHSDDAGVYRLTSEIALIQTLDFFTPIVDDPFVFGRIAAANGLSDVYAMGGKPLTAMNIVCFPVKKFSLDVMGKILAGGLSVLDAAGVQLLGGHSVDDDELKYGVSVTGIVHPDRVLTNRGLRDGDALVLTKALGTGILGTAVKGMKLEPAEMDAFVSSMTALNARAAEIMGRYAVHACTDVTGFGLAGHLLEMCGDDALEVTIDSSKLVLLPGAANYADMGMIPGGLYRNRDFCGARVSVGAAVPRAVADLVFDPQTSGGLLIALAPDEAESLVRELNDNGVSHARIIARVKAARQQRVLVV